MSVTNCLVTHKLNKKDKALFNEFYNEQKEEGLKPTEAGRMAAYELEQIIYNEYLKLQENVILKGGKLPLITRPVSPLTENKDGQIKQGLDQQEVQGVQGNTTAERDTTQSDGPRGNINGLENEQTGDVQGPSESTNGEETSVRPPGNDVEGGRGSENEIQMESGGRTDGSLQEQPDVRPGGGDTGSVRVDLPNFHIDNPKVISGGTQVQRFNKNKNAVETYQKLKGENKSPTPEQQKIIAGYTGWGSFGQELFQGNWDNPKYIKGWEDRNNWLRENLNKDDWVSAQNSISNAHFTDAVVISAMWDAVSRMGFTGGKVLEPAMGIGNFFGMMPVDMADRSQLTGIELDSLTGGMAQMLYPQANINIKGYETSKTPDNFYDLAISNVPFIDIPVADRKYMKLNPRLHDYFFLKMLDQVRPGGLVMAVTSKGTMDKVDHRIRRELAKKSDLVGAFRLPSGAFQKNAGTQVVTDILIFKKRESPLEFVNDDWIKSIKFTPISGLPTGQKLNINKHFVLNPKDVLGEIAFSETGMYGGGNMIVTETGASIKTKLNNAVKRLPEDIYTPLIHSKDIRYITNHTDDRQGALVENDQGFFIVQGEHLVNADDKTKWIIKDQNVTKKRQSQFTQLITIRKKYAELIENSRSDVGIDVEITRKQLNNLYKAFIKEHGLLNDSFGLKYLRKIKDPFFQSLSALEVDGKSAPILTKATTRSFNTIKNPSIDDAYVLARNQFVSPRLEDIAKLSGKPIDEIRETLVKDRAVFVDEGGGIIPSDVYLSGNVKIKLHSAQAAVKNGHEEMQRNVDALLEVIPADIPYHDIEAKLGASWIRPEIYNEYIKHMLNTDDNSIETTYRSGKWKVEFDTRLNHSTEGHTGFGTPVAPFKQLVNYALSNKIIKLTTKDSDGNVYVLTEATAEANEKIANIRDTFSEWIWSDIDRRIALENEYNEVRNAYSEPNFDGSFLKFEGMSLQLGEKPFNLRKHQRDAIWRALVKRKSLNAHEVGTGKTFTIGGIAIESRRYGIASKPLILAHNANSAAVASEIQAMYPAAKILYIDNLDKKNLKLRMQQIANDDWDAIIMPHSQISNLALKEETLMDMAQEEIDALYLEAKEAAKEDGVTIESDMWMDDEEVGKLRSQTAKQLVKERKKIIESIRKQAMKSTREDAVAFEDLGIDMIMVDEAHCFPYEAKVMTNHGILQIGEIVENRLNVKVLSYVNGELIYQKITQYWKNNVTNNGFLKISIGDDTIICTSNHHIYVEGRGYVEAGSIKTGEKVRVLQEDIRSQSKRGERKKTKMLLSEVQGRTQEIPGNKNMHGVSERVSVSQSWGKEKQREVVLSEPMCCNMENDSIRKNGKEYSENEQGNVSEMENRQSISEEDEEVIIRANEKKQSDEESQNGRKNASINERKDVPIERRERETDSTSNIITQSNELTDGISNKYSKGNEEIQESTELLQSRSSRSQKNVSHRSGRENAQIKEMEVSGQTKNRGTKLVRVDSIKILERGSLREYGRSIKEDKYVYDLGIEGKHNYFADNVLVHNSFKKPPIVTKMKMKGLNTQSSERSISLRFLTKYIRGMNNGGNVHLFTGTPITNTLTEIYHMQRYLMEEEMSDTGVDYWDGWFGSFASEVQDIEQSSSGEFETVTRLAAFINIPELRKMIGQYMDVVFSNDMPEMKPRKTKSGKILSDKTLTDSEKDELENGRTENAEDRPYKKIIALSEEMSELQLEAFEEVKRRAKAFKDMDGKARYTAIKTGADEAPLIYEQYAERASFDIRLLNNEALAGQEGKVPDTPNSKASRVVENVSEIYKGDDKASQVIFMDKYLSKTATRKVGEPGSRRTITYPVFSVGRDIVERLVQSGIPREKIAIVDMNVKGPRRKEIADMMNTGEIRVVIGSTQSLGVGVNMQKNLRAIHHVDAPWMPGELEQRNGRGHRQGNQYNTVLEYRYLTDRIDGRRWQVLAKKAKFINEFMHSKGDTRHLEGEVAAEKDDILDTFAEAAGDPRILLKEQYKKNIKKYERKERLYSQSITDAKIGIRSETAKITNTKKTISEIENKKRIADIILSSETNTNIINGKDYKTRKAANTRLKQLANKLIGIKESNKIGEVYGYPATLYRDANNKVNIIIEVEGVKFVSRVASIESLETELRSENKTYDWRKEEVEKGTSTLKRLKQVVKDPFKDEQNLINARQAFNDIEQDMYDNPNPPPVWLRNGAPVGTDVYVNGKIFEVAGHSYTNEGWFIKTSDGKTISYVDIQDNQGMNLYDERPFIHPDGSVSDNDNVSNDNEYGDGSLRESISDAKSIYVDDAGNVGVVLKRGEIPDGYEVSGNSITDIKRKISRRIRKLNRIFHPTVLQSVDELPPNDFNIPIDTKGVFLDGTVYIFADNNSLSEVGVTLAHEIYGHSAVELYTGKAFNKVIDLIKRMKSNKNPKVMEVLEQIKRNYLDDNGNYTLDEVSEAREIIAHIAETDTRHPLIKRIIAMIKEFMAKRGWGSYTLGDAAIAKLLAESARFAENKNTSFSIDASGMPVALNKPVLKRGSRNERQGKTGVLSKMGADRKDIITRSKEWLDDTLDSFRQGLFDQYDALLRNDKIAYGDDVLRKSTSSSAWVLAKFSNAAEGALHAMLDYGRVKMDDNGMIDMVDDKSIGLIEMLKPLGSKHEINKFFAWIATQRSIKLAEEGRENLFTPVDVKEAEKFYRDNKTVYDSIYKQFNQMQNDVLDIAVKGNVLSEEMAEQYKNEFYVPFYRMINENETTVNPYGGVSGLARQRFSKRLKGGKENLGDLLDNTITNWNNLIGASLKNNAAVQAIDTAMDDSLQLAEETTNKLRDKKSSTYILRKGKKVWYNIDDKLTFRALTALQQTGMNNTTMKIMRKFKRVFTSFVTASPQFIAANLMRDSIQAAALADMDYNPVANAITGAKQFNDKNINKRRMIASGGAFSFGHLYHNDPDAIKDFIEREFIKNKHLIENPKDVTRLLKMGWDKYAGISNRAENANRIVIYEKAIKDGKTHQQASLESRDLMDFSARGDWVAIRILTDIVPFLNARLQGLDKLYRSGGKPIYNVMTGKASTSDKLAAKRFAIIQGAVSLSAIALYMSNKDDEEYQELEEWERDTYFHFKVGDSYWRMPRPFEIGALATLGERIVEQVVDDKATGKLFAERFGHMLMQTFAFNPTPQMVKPLIDAYANKDSFTGRNIESMGMKNLSAENRVRSNTTVLAKTTSKILAGTFGSDSNLVISPVKVDFLIQQYLGWVGASANGLIDTMINPDVKPSKKWYEYNPVKRFYKELPSQYSKYTTQFYNNLTQARRIYNDIKYYREIGEDDKAQELIDDNLELLRYRKKMNRAQKKMSNINKELKFIRANDEMSPNAKREDIRFLMTRKRMIAKVFKDVKG